MVGLGQDAATSRGVALNVIPTQLPLEYTVVGSLVEVPQGL